VVSAGREAQIVDGDRAAGDGPVPASNDDGVVRGRIGRRCPTTARLTDRSRTFEPLKAANEKAAQRCKNGLSMCSQPDVGREHKPKCVIANERNIDEYCNEGKKRNDERNYVHAENIEDTDSGNAHIAILLRGCKRKRSPIYKIDKAKNELITFFYGNAGP
jgi:hypothetical protein